MMKKEVFYYKTARIQADSYFRAGKLQVSIQYFSLKIAKMTC